MNTCIDFIIREFPSHSSAQSAWEAVKRLPEQRNGEISVGPIYLLGRNRHAFQVWKNYHLREDDPIELEDSTRIKPNLAVLPCH